MSATCQSCGHEKTDHEPGYDCPHADGSSCWQSGCCNADDGGNDCECQDFVDAAPQPQQQEPKTPETDEDHLWCNTCDHHRSGHGLGINACVESPCTCKRFLSIAMIKAQTWEEGWKARAKWEDVTTCHDASDRNPYAT